MFAYGISIKIVGAAIAALLFLGLGFGAVYSYKKAIAERERLKIENKAQAELVAKRLKQLESMKVYQVEQSKVAGESSNKVAKILSQRSARDAKGNIQPDDAVLYSLNSMFNKND